MKKTRGSAHHYERTANLRQRLLGTSRVVNRAIVAGLNQRGFPQLRSTHTALLSNLDLDGASLTTVAQRAGISKQAMGRLASELVELNYINSHPDKHDRRAVQLVFTKTGLDLMQQSFLVMADIERRCASRIGINKFKNLLASLNEIAIELEDP